MTGTAPRPRVAFVLHSMHVAGAEVLVTEIIRRLRHRIDAVVLCLDGVGALGESLREEGTPVLALDRTPGLDRGLVTRLANAIREHGVDVVHAHQYTPFFYAALAKVRLHRPLHLIFTEHGRHYPDVVSSKRRLVNRYLLSRLANEITGVCGFSIRSLADMDGFGHRHLVVVPNGIDLTRYSLAIDRDTACRMSGIPPERRHVVCIARFHPVKDHETLVAAFATVASARPDTDLLLAGDGTLRAALESQVASLGLRDRVRFLGVRSDVPALLRASEVFALTSLSEAASITVLEAMACARPAVVTAVGGNPDLIREGLDGRLVPRGDRAALAAALLDLLADPAKATAMGQSGRRRVESSFLLEDTVASYAQMYEAGSARVLAARGDGR
jgi:L-malate glycosyltransferase